MPYIDYLFRLLMKHQMLHELEKLTEKTFVGQVCLSRKAWYVMTFIYNAYRLWISVRTDWKKEIYGLHQSSSREVKLKDSNSLEAALRELREKIRLRI